MSLAMSVAQREEFLAGVHVGVLGIGGTGGGSPLLVPVWYAYRPGGQVVVLTGRESVKARWIRAAGRFALCAQSETAPYRYVSVEGPVVAFEDGVAAGEREELAHRYLPPETARAYLKATEGQLESDVTFRMAPERWRTADFSAFATAFGG